MHRATFSGILVALLSLAVVLAGAGAQGLEVKGMIRGRDGFPRGPASIQLSGQQRYIAVSTALGEFTLSGVQPGEYTVTVTQGDKMHRFPVTVRGDVLDLRVPW